MFWRGAAALRFGCCASSTHALALAPLADAVSVKGRRHQMD